MGGSGMKVWILAAAMSVATGAATASSPFDGRWIDDLKTATGDQSTDVYRVDRGLYICNSCSPKRSYPSDGKLRPVTGDPSVSEATSIIGPRSIMTRTIGRDMVRETTMTVSEDNRTATYIALDKWPDRRRRLLTKYIAKRVAPSPLGSHLVSGSWLGLAYVVVPEEYRSIDLKDTGADLSFNNLRHGHYTARYGGPPVTLHLPGDDTYTVSVRKPDEQSRMQSIFHNGELVSERTYSISADGRSLRTTVRHPKDGTVISYTAHKKM